MSDIQGCLKDRGLTQIPSELIEPYLQAMLSVELECIAFTPTEKRLQEAKQNLKGVESFVSRFCGIHARYATNNVYASFYTMTLDEAKKIVG
jgi:hypothetical protein